MMYLFLSIVDLHWIYLSAMADLYFSLQSSEWIGISRNQLFSLRKYAFQAIFKDSNQIC